MLIHGDCRTELPKIESNSIDLVCTDPPQFLDGLSDEWKSDKGRSAVVGNLPKGMKFDRSQSVKFREFYTEISKEIFRVLKPGGAFLSFSSPRLYHAMASAMEDAGFEIRDMMGWIYTQSQVKAFSQDHIIEKDKTRTPAEKEALKEKCRGWRTPQLKPAIEPICVAFKPIEGRFIDNFETQGTGLLNASATTGDNRFPSNVVTTESLSTEMDTVFLVPKPSKAEKEGNDHMTVKPVALMEHLIRLFTTEDSRVLDPFLGSGTTAVACQNLKRNWIGIEIDPAHIKICRTRTSS